MPTTFYSGGEQANLSGGMQMKTSDLLREANQVLLAINVHGDRVGSLQKRPGYSLIGSQITDNQNVLTVHPYYQAGADKRLIAIVNSGGNATIHYSTGGAWTVISSSTATTGVYYNGEQFLNYVFFVGHDGTSTFGNNFYLSGTGLASASDISGMPQAKYIRRYKDLLYVGNVRIGGTNYPSRVYYSSTPSSGAITWPTTNFFPVPEDNNEEITGLEVNADRLLIFKERSLYRWDESEVRYVAGIGTPTGRSIKTINDITFYYSQNGAGIYAYAGGKPKLISQKIQPVIDAIPQTSVENVRAEGDFDHYYLFVGNLTLQLPAGDTLAVNNVVIVYTISTNTWYLYSLSDNVQSMCRFVDDTNGFDRIYFGNNDGEVFRLALDVDNVFSDDGEAISSLVRYRTPIGIPHQSKTLHRIWTLTDRAQGITLRARGDDKDWKREKQVNFSGDDLVLDLEGKTFEMEVSESSALAPFILNGFAFSVSQRTNAS